MSNLTDKQKLSFIDLSYGKKVLKEEQINKYQSQCITQSSL